MRLLSFYLYPYAYTSDGDNEKGSGKVKFVSFVVGRAGGGRALNECAYPLYPWPQPLYAAVYPLNPRPQALYRARYPLYAATQPLIGTSCSDCSYGQTGRAQ